MTGDRLALTIGINDYPGTGSDLTGCVNDAQGWANALGQRGFAVTTLLDSQATGRGIFDAIRRVVSAAQFGDVVVITYSGHGTWLPDLSGDEPDRRDEALVPYDAAETGLVLTDDQLHELFSLRAHGVRLVFLSDSCHSGSVTRLAGPVMPSRPRVRFLPPQAWMREEMLPGARAVAAVPPRGASRNTALLMSGCADPEYSYDGFGGAQMGAFSYVALGTLSRLHTGATYREWHAEIRKALPAADCPQTPQLLGSKEQRGWPVFLNHVRR